MSLKKISLNPEKWQPKKPSAKIRKLLIKGEVPWIRLFNKKDELTAEAHFPYYSKSLALPFLKKNHLDKTPPLSFTIPGSKAEYVKVISGDINLVFAKALRDVPKDYRSEFLDLWNRCQLDLINQNKINDKKNSNQENDYHLFNIKPGHENLLFRIKQSNLSAEEISKESGIDAATIYRYMKNPEDGGSVMTRNNAVKIAKALGLDPAEVMFNDLYIPIWGSTNLTDLTNIGTTRYTPSEIKKSYDKKYALCPRDIYRPEVRAFSIEETSKVVFYNHSKIGEQAEIRKSLKNGDEVVVGVFDKENNLKYFYGAYENYNDKINILNADPLSAWLEYEKGEDPMEHIKMVDDLRYVLKDCKPLFISQVIAIVDQKLIEKNSERSAALKNTKAYADNRKSELVETLHNEKKRLEDRLLMLEKQYDKKANYHIKNIKKARDHLMLTKANIDKKIKKYFESTGEIFLSSTYKGEKHSYDFAVKDKNKIKYYELKSNKDGAFINLIKSEDYKQGYKDQISKYNEMIDAIHELTVKGSTKVKLYEIDELIQRFGVTPEIQAYLKDSHSMDIFPDVPQTKLFDEIPTLKEEKKRA